MLRRLYDRILLLAASPRAPLWLALVAFVESSFVPIPPDPLLGAMALARPDRAWRYAAICTIGSVLGGMLGYLIGYALFEQVARPLLEFYNQIPAYDALRDRFNQFGLYVILAKGITPIPYKIITITSGAVHFDFLTFVAASVVTRGVRFFALALLLRYFGDEMRRFIEKRLAAVVGASVALALAGFVALKYI